MGRFAHAMSELRSVVVGAVGLEIAAVVALVLTVARRGDRPDARAARLLLVGTALQAVHFAEELATGFQVRFPALRGLPPWSDEFFVAFNVGWLAIWAVAARGLRRGVRAAYFPAWFFALAGIGNGLVHPACALLVGGYFPGLLSSPVVGGAGALLWARLWATTRVPSG
jgi:hypothetical protein